MKKSKINSKVEDAAKEREKRWKELRSLMEKNDGMDKSKLKLMQEYRDGEVDRILKEIGMDRYSSIMKENGVDDKEILLELQENHLEEMGIVLGHRLKIMKKIRELKGEPSNQPRPEKLFESSESSHKSILKSTGKELSQKKSIEESPIKPVLINNKQDSKKKFLTVDEIFAHFEEKKDPDEKTGKIQPKLPQTVLLSTTEKPKNSQNEKMIKTMKTQETDTNDVPITISPALKTQKFSEGSDKNLLKNTAASQYSPVSDNKGKDTVIELFKPPLASKPVTVARNLAIYQPSSNEIEKSLKLSEFINKGEEETGKQDIKWEGFSYVPYKPSEEIQAISNKPSSRPTSAANEGKHFEREEKSKEKFDVAGWDN